MTTDGHGDGPDDRGWLEDLAVQRRGRSRPGQAPLGRSVSSALILPPGVLPRDRQLRALLATIDAIHGDGDLPPLRVRWGVLPLGLVALYRSTGDQRESVSLTINPNRARWLLATAHEIGHLLDHHGIGRRGHLASSGSRLLSGWRAAVGRSRAVRGLGAFSDADPYFSSAEELWARSYAQWIAYRSPDATLEAQVVEFRGHDPADPAFYLQWDRDDFEPIAEAIDRLFRRLGWLG